MARGIDPHAQTELSEPGKQRVTVVSMPPQSDPIALPGAPAAPRPRVAPWQYALAVLAGAATSLGLAYALR